MQAQTLPQTQSIAAPAIVVRETERTNRHEVWASNIYAGQVFQLGDISSEYANPAYYVARAPRGADGFEPNDQIFASLDEAASYLAGRVTPPLAADLDTRWTITAAGLRALIAYTPPTPPAAPQRAPRPAMTSATLEARARQRAHAEHVHIFAVAGLPGCYVTRSKSNPAERYQLVAGPDGIIGCSCAGFYYRQSCKHSEALKARLAREALQAERCSRQLQAVA